MKNAERVPSVPRKTVEEISELAYGTLCRLFGHPQNSLQPGAYAAMFEKGGLSKIGIGYGVEILPEGLPAAFDAVKREIILSEDVYYRLQADDFGARLALAHEIGHAVMHGPYLLGEIAAGKRIGVHMRGQIAHAHDPEWQADTFAIEFVLLAPLIRKCLHEGYSLARLAELFRAPREGIEARCKELMSR